MTDEPSPTFGQLLRQGRLAAGLSQAALAERAGLSERAIGALEGGERRAPYPATVGRLARALRLPPADRARLQAAVAPRHAAARLAPGRSREPAGPLAALTSFVGRERELAELAGLLPTARLLTLTGAGGVGKTRLALELARAARPGYPDGIWLVELAALADSALVPQAVAAVLGVIEQVGRPLTETLANWLAGKRLLLALDNCEHLLDACARLAEALLRACPQLHVVATSREALGVPGEVTWRVPSLALPDAADQASVEALTRVAAVHLFAERARAARPGFAVTPENAAAVAQVCVRLDGLPLAIELAAARVPALTVGQIAARLDDRFRLLTAGSRTALPRQQTLLATFDWSYDLLSADERAVLRRLAVFAGGCSLEAAEYLCGEAGNGGGGGEGTAEPASRPPHFPASPVDVLDVLARLVGKSLVQVEERAGEARYRLLETVRQYAGERLEEAGEAAATRDRHRDHFLALAERAGPHLETPEQPAWFARLDAEHDNLRTALACSLERAPRAGLRLAASLWNFWHLRGYHAEGRRWLDDVLARAPEPTLERARALEGAQYLPLVHGDWPVAQARLDEGLALSRTLGDRGLAASTLRNLGWLHLLRGEFAQARARLEEGLALSRTLDSPIDLAYTRYWQGELAEREGDYARARALLGEVLATAQARGAAKMLAAARWSLGNLARVQGDAAEAAAHYEAGLAPARAVGFVRGIAWALLGLGQVAQLQGEAARALGLLRESLELSTRIGDRWSMGLTLTALGRVAWGQGDAMRATAWLCDSLTLRRAMGDRPGIAEGLEGLAAVAAGQGQPGQAARLLGAAEALRQVIGAPLPPVDRPDYEARVQAARAALGADAFAAARAAGQALPLEQAVAEALAAAEAPPSPGAPPALARLPTNGPEHLTAREAEIASLMARGLSNRELADDLAISERTVERHLTNIRAKLGVTGRVQVATWALARGLGAAAPRP